MKKKIIVTGANGFIGANLCNTLFERGYDITAMVRHTADVSLLNLDSSIVYCDYTKLDELELTLSQYNIVVHLAAMTRAKDFDTLYNANVLLTQDIVNIVNSSLFCNQLIFISSQAAVGVANGTTPVTEDTLEKPISWYGNSKFFAEKKVKNCTKDWTIIRPSSVYGEGDKDFLSYFQMVNKRLAPVPGIKEKYISLIYVKQLCEIIIKCLDNDKVSQKIIHASDNHTYTINDFITALAQVMNKRCLKMRIPNKLIVATGGVIDFFAGNSKKTPVFNKQKALELSQESWLLDSTESLKLLEIEFTETLADNLRQTYQWYREQNLL